MQNNNNSRRNFLKTALTVSVVAATSTQRLLAEDDNGSSSNDKDKGKRGNVQGLFPVKINDFPALKTVNGSAQVPVPNLSRKMIVTRTSQSEFVAVSGECTHEQCQVEAFDASSMRIICDCHGSRYDVKGIVQAGSPATKNLQQFSTTYTSGADTVFVNVPGFVATSAKNDAQITTAVEQNFPNPAVGMTTIEYSVAEPTKVSIIVYSFLGKEIIRLVDKFHEPGIYKVQCNASALGNGVYLYRMSTSEGFVQTRKLTISQ